jgi:hypothetical protein
VSALPLWAISGNRQPRLNLIRMERVTLVLPNPDYEILLAACLRGEAWRTGANVSAAVLAGVFTLAIDPILISPPDALLLRELPLTTYTGWNVRATSIRMQPEQPLPPCPELPDWDRLAQGGPGCTPELLALLRGEKSQSPPAAADDGHHSRASALAIGLGAGLGAGVAVLVLLGSVLWLRRRKEHDRTRCRHGAVSFITMHDAWTECSTRNTGCSSFHAVVASALFAADLCLGCAAPLHPHMHRLAAASSTRSSELPQPPHIATKFSHHARGTTDDLPGTSSWTTMTDRSGLATADTPRPPTKLYQVSSLLKTGLGVCFLRAPVLWPWLLPPA